jgi:hypothetical protein
MMRASRQLDGSLRATGRPRLRPDLRIIEQDTWREMKVRLATIRAHYTRNADRTTKGRAISGVSRTNSSAALQEPPEHGIDPVCGGPPCQKGG